MTRPPRTPSRLAAVIVQYLPTGYEKEIARITREQVSACAASEELITEAYSVADTFSFTPRYLAGRHVSWLGKSHVAQVPGVPEVGAVTVNHVLVTNGIHYTAALHQHIAIENEVVLDQGNADPIAAAVRTLHELYWLQGRDGKPSAWVEAVDPFHALADRNQEGLFARRAIYLSVLLPAEHADLIADWNPIAPALYSLLNLHAEGVDPTTAAAALHASQFSSTNFFVGFFQSEAIVSVAVPYPPANIVAPWPALLPTTETEARETLQRWNTRRAELGLRFEAYDLSPEYPALRYTAMALLEFAGNAAYAEWRIRTELAKVMTRGWLPGLLAAIAASRRIDRVYFQARSLEMLRLPAVRDTAGRAINAKVMEESGRAIDGMRASLTNWLLAFLAAAAVVVAVAQIAITLIRP